MVDSYYCFSFCRSGRWQSRNSFADSIFEGRTRLFSVFTQHRRAALTLCFSVIPEGCLFFTSFPFPPFYHDDLWEAMGHFLVQRARERCDEGREGVVIPFLVPRRVLTSWRHWIKSGFGQQMRSWMLALGKHSWWIPHADLASIDWLVPRLSIKIEQRSTLSNHFYWNLWSLLKTWKIQRDRRETYPWVPASR